MLASFGFWPRHIFFDPFPLRPKIPTLILSSAFAIFKMVENTSGYLPTYNGTSRLPLTEASGPYSVGTVDLANEKILLRLFYPHKKHENFEEIYKSRMRERRAVCREVSKWNQRFRKSFGSFLLFVLIYYIFSRRRFLENNFSINLLSFPWSICHGFPGLMCSNKLRRGWKGTGKGSRNPEPNFFRMNASPKEQREGKNIFKILHGNP